MNRMAPTVKKKPLRFTKSRDLKIIFKILPDYNPLVVLFCAGSKIQKIYSRRQIIQVH
jgi:hypothetical protein